MGGGVGVGQVSEVSLCPLERHEEGEAEGLSPKLAWLSLPVDLIKRY